MDGMNEKTTDRERIEEELGEPGPERIWYVGDAFAQGFTVDEVHQLTHIDPWFLYQIEEIVQIELALEKKTLADLDEELLLGSSARASLTAGLPTFWTPPKQKFANCAMP